MEEYDYKLSQNNPVIIHNGINNLVNKIRLLKNSPDQKEFEKHLKYLRDKAFYEKLPISTTAALGLIHLMEGPNAILKLDLLLNDALAALSQNVNLSGLIEVFFYILFKTNEHNYGIMKNQHPLITVLKKDQNCWPHLVSKIHEKFREEPRDKVLNKLKSFALYVLYDNERKVDPLFQIELLSIYKINLDETTQQKILVLNPNHLIKSSRYCKVLLSSNPIMISYLLLSTKKMFECNVSASENLWILHDHLLLAAEGNYSLAMLVLADCLISCPVIYLESLLESAMLLLKLSNYNNLILNSVKCSLLIWKLHFSNSLNHVNTVTEKKLDQILLMSPKYNNNGHKTKPNICLNQTLYLYSWFANNDITEDFLEELLETPSGILLKIFTPLLGFFYETTLFVESTLKLLLKCCEVNLKLTTRVLPVILAKITICFEPRTIMTLFRTLPQLGALKENLVSIISTIRALSRKSEDMQAFAVSLFYDFVLMEKRNFPYLQEILVRATDDANKEILLAKTFVVRELIRKNINLESYGTELTAFLSNVLNIEKGDTQIITFAFEGLKYLCEYDILDLISTISNLEHKFKDDSRVQVTKGLCGIFGLMAHYPGMEQDAKYEQIIEMCLQKLWNYTLSDTETEIYEAAYKALSGFSMEKLAINFPATYVKISNDESIHGCIAGACWVNLLLHANKKGLKAAANMLIEFINKYMKSYKRNVLESEGNQEPLYMHLPRDNILSAVAKFVKKNSSNRQQVDREVYLEALRILSYNYGKPTPAMDWTFLQTLKDVEGMQEYCLNIASRQSSVSNSARNIIENRIASITEKTPLDPSTFYIYKNLEYLFNSIQPVIMKPFFKKTILWALQNLKDREPEINIIFGSIIDELNNKNALEANKNTVADVALGILENLEHDSKEFQKLTQLLGCLPAKYISEFSAVQFETVNTKIMYRCLAIRCSTAAACDEEPFQLLDSLVDCRILRNKNPYFTFEDLFGEVFIVIHKHSSHKSLPGWLKELLVKVQLELAEHQDMRNVLFSCSLLLIAFVVASGFYVFKNGDIKLSDFTDCFPYAADHLLRQTAYTPYISQVLESLYDISTNKTYKRSENCIIISQSFKKTLLLMRKHEKFNENYAWMKYVEVDLN